MIAPGISLAILMIAIMMWMVNKLMKCSSYALGYSLVLVQGAGLGLFFEFWANYFGWI